LLRTNSCTRRFSTEDRERLLGEPLFAAFFGIPQDVAAELERFRLLHETMWRSDVLTEQRGAEDCRAVLLCAGTRPLIASCIEP